MPSHAEVNDSVLYIMNRSHCKSARLSATNVIIKAPVLSFVWSGFPF